MATYSGRSLHGQVVHELGRRIGCGRYPEGTVLPNEEVLALELDVSRTALREATKVLVAKGLLDVKPRVGMRVRPRSTWNLLDPDVLAWRSVLGPEPDFLLELAEVREALEPGAAALAARKRTPAQLRLVQASFARMAAARTEAEWVAADLDFHRAILAATGNAMLNTLGAVIAVALEGILVRNAERAGRFDLSLPEHEAITRAIERQDEAGAHEAMRTMLADARARLPEPVATP